MFIFVEWKGRITRTIQLREYEVMGNNFVAEKRVSRHTCVSWWEIGMNEQRDAEDARITWRQRALGEFFFYFRVESATMDTYFQRR